MKNINLDFEKKIINYLDLDKKFDIEYSVEPKIDGISASLTYQNGLLVKEVLSIVDRREGGYETLKEQNVQLKSLFSIEDFL